MTRENWADTALGILVLGVWALSMYMWIQEGKQPHSSTLEPERERAVNLAGRK